MTRHELEDAMARGERPEFLFFWGHRPRPDGRITASCLSQWYEAPFILEGLSFPTAEHAMMHGKATLFGDLEAAARVLAAPDPATAKQIGREVRGFDAARWAEARERIVLGANMAKFGQHLQLRDFLVGTGATVLVEASPEDRVWGIGLGREHPDAAVPARWRGLNLLGFALMQVRNQLLQP